MSVGQAPSVPTGPRGAEAHKVPEKKSMRQEWQLAICALGIYTCYLRYGLLQERIYTTAHGPEAERYSYSLFLVAVQTATNAAAAAIALAFGLFKKEQKESAQPVANFKSGKGFFRGVPLTDYFIVSLSYLSAMVFSFTALNYMSYPMQALGKSCKMIPVMLMGIVIRRRRYSIRDYTCVLLVTIGVATFSWKSKKSTVPTSPLGFSLLFASLFMDGVTGPLQERLVAQYKPSTHELMFWQNICSVAWLTLACILTGEGARAIAFIVRYPSTLADMMAFSVVSALGQNFIFYTVRNFNALIVTTITTTRKMFTVLLSIFLYNHAMVSRQWFGLLLVFVAITWEAVAKQKAKAAKAVKIDSETSQSSASTTAQEKKAQ